MKNKNIRNVPELRFPGFEGEWESRKLGELCQIEKGKQINKKTLSTSGKYYVLNGGINPSGYTDKFNTEANTISINEGGSCGFVKLNTTRFWSGGHNYTLLKPKCEVKYLYNYLKCREKYINSLAVGTGIPNIQKKVLQETIQVSYPLIQEQTKIGTFFQTIDALISATEKELESCREQKRGMLQKMFPKNGETVPEIRFPGFTDAWEQRKLGDIVPITMGQSPDGSTYSDKPSDYILVQGNADLQNGWVTPRIWTTQITKKADAGDLIMSVRAPAGAMGKTAYNAVIGRGVAAIKGNEFIYQLLVKMDSDGYWKTLSCGSTFESLNSNNIKNADVLIPNTDEQEKIGDYFANLDNLITLHQRELDRLLELKKGFMQKMFC